jgi:hypothetical protein
MEHIVSCPQAGCGAAAEIVDRWVWLSTDGPVEQVKIWCVNGHGFTPALGGWCSLLGYRSSAC